jgi:hypothetical protein
MKRLAICSALLLGTMLWSGKSVMADDWHHRHHRHGHSSFSLYVSPYRSYYFAPDYYPSYAGSYGAYAYPYYSHGYYPSYGYYAPSYRCGPSVGFYYSR